MSQVWESGVVRAHALQQDGRSLVQYTDSACYSHVCVFVCV